MTDAGWIEAVDEKTLREHSMLAVFPGGLPVLLVRKAGNEIYALENKCAHMGCPLTRGVLSGYVLQCPCHDWRFDIRTGIFESAEEIKITVYQYKQEQGKIYIKVKEKL